MLDGVARDLNRANSHIAHPHVKQDRSRQKHAGARDRRGRRWADVDGMHAQRAAIGRRADILQIFFLDVARDNVWCCNG